jgi:hypothetical protein
VTWPATPPAREKVAGSSPALVFGMGGNVKVNRGDDGATISLAPMEKLVGLLIPICTVIGGLGGNYVLNNWRMSATEKRVDQIEVRLMALEQNGNTDEERRITKLEGRQDVTDQTVNGMDKKLDTAITILNRIDRQAHNP